MLPATLVEPAAAVAELLTARGETISIAESASGGLISAALVAVPGASAYYVGGVVVYTLVGAEAQLPGGPALPENVVGASEPFARWLASSAAATLSTGWGLGETGAAGPRGNRYGSPAGAAWVAVHRPDGQTLAREIQTGSEDRPANMQLFAAAALGLLYEALAD